METERIDDITLAHLNSDGSGTAADVEAFKAACRGYQRATGCTEREAIDAIWGDGDFGHRLFWGEPGYADRFLGAQRLLSGYADFRARISSPRNAQTR